MPWAKHGHQGCNIGGKELHLNIRAEFFRPGLRYSRTSPSRIGNSAPLRHAPLTPATEKALLEHVEALLADAENADAPFRSGPIVMKVRVTWRDGNNERNNITVERCVGAIEQATAPIGATAMPRFGFACPTRMRTRSTRRRRAGPVRLFRRSRGTARHGTAACLRCSVEQSRATMDPPEFRLVAVFTGDRVIDDFGGGTGASWQCRI
jgi:hypothetical protein